MALVLFVLRTIVCALCGEDGHNTRTCPLSRQDAEATKRPPAGSPVKEKMNELKKLRCAIDEQRQSSAGSSASADHTSSVLEAIELLSAKMDRMALKPDLQELQTTIETSTKVAVAEAVDPLKLEFHELKSCVDELEKNKQAQDVPMAAQLELPGDLKENLQKQIDEIERQLKANRKPTQAADTQSTVYVGGLSGWTTMEDAQKWMNDEL